MSNPDPKQIIPDPGKSSGSERIRIHNTGRKVCRATIGLQFLGLCYKNILLQRQSFGGFSPGFPDRQQQRAFQQPIGAGMVETLQQQQPFPPRFQEEPRGKEFIDSS